MLYYFISPLFSLVFLSCSNLQTQEPVDMDVYYITHGKCTECVGFHDEPQCAAVCPVDCCVDDPDYRESEDELLAKKSFLHL